ncbi:MAG: hypothetical protein R6V62_00275 [Candidatus Fermentibacteraceae bacterium]
MGDDVSYPGFPGALAGLIFIIIGGAGLLLSSSCSSGERVLVSQSGEYSAFLTIQRVPEGYGVWVVNVTGEEDMVLLTETMPDHPASLMAYLAWDDSDRLWWSGSDDGSVFYWSSSVTGWIRNAYSSDHQGGPVPPQSLFTGGNRTRSER